MPRGLTRLTNAFNKKWVNLKAALPLHFAWYILCRFTTCKNPEVATCLNERFVVGYLRKARALWRGRWAVQGALRSVSFEDSFPLRDLFSGRRHRSMKLKKLDTRETEKVLARLRKGKNVLPECLREIARLKGGNKRLRSKGRLILCCYDAPEQPHRTMVFSRNLR